MARFLIILGIGLIALGLIWYFIPWLVNWFGKLPGDIRIETEQTHFYMPITSMIIVSLILSIIFSLFNR